MLVSNEDKRAWFDTFKYAWDNLIDKSNPHKLQTVIHFLKTDSIAQQFYFMDILYMSEVDKVLKPYKE